MIVNDSYIPCISVKSWVSRSGGDQEFDDDSDENNVFVSLTRLWHQQTSMVLLLRRETRDSQLLYRKNFSPLLATHNIGDICCEILVFNTF